FESPWWRAIDHRQPYRWAPIRRRSQLCRRIRSSLIQCGQSAAERELVMAQVQGLLALREAYTFDDVLLKPGLSDILPSEVDIRSRVTRDIPLNIPIVASAMDTV